MSADDSITRWIHELREGEEDAAEMLWSRYFQRMVRQANRSLGPGPPRAGDAEDVALSAFYSFCDGAQRGAFPQLKDRDNLWPLLVAITGYKTIDMLRRENRIKRGGTGKADAPGETSSAEARARKISSDFQEVISREPTPEAVAETADQLNRLLDLLDETGDADLRTVALRKLKGHRTSEIAEELGCVRRTVERKMQLIVQLWEREFPE